MASEPRKIGPWRLVDKLGKGGNATVWRAASADDGREVALKVVDAKRGQAERYKRFAREIEFLRSLEHFPGVLPVLDAHLPTKPSARDRAWLAMPIATPIDAAVRDASLEIVVQAMAHIASTLAALAEQHGVGHRDVKPGNLYELDGEWLIGDFGLIDVPNVDELTRSGRPMGPANFTAYEVIRDPRNADARRADVYSLGKTLWALATGINWPPLGHQPADSDGYTISDQRPHPHAKHLDRLVDRMTRLDPDARPAMREVAADLTAWRELETSALAIDVADLGSQLRAKLAGEIAAHDLQQERKELALEAVRALQERCRPLNDALRELHSRVTIDGRDKLTDNVLGRRHSHWGREQEFLWTRCSSILAGSDHAPFGLRMGRCVELLSDGTLLARWLLDVGPLKSSGTEFHESKTDYEAPVGSVEQERMLERFSDDLGSRLAAALSVFVAKAPSS